MKPTIWQVIKKYWQEDTIIGAPRLTFGVNYKNELPFTLHLNMTPQVLPSDGDIPMGREDLIELRDAINKALEDTRTDKKLQDIREKYNYDSTNPF